MRKRIVRGVAWGLISALVLAVVSVNYLVRRNKDYLIGHIEQALNRKVSADLIEVTFWPVGARFVNLVIAEGPAFDNIELLRASDVRIEYAALALLLGRVRLKSIALKSPIITIVRDGRGRYNFAQPIGNRPNQRNSVPGSEKGVGAIRGGQLFFVRWFGISGGTLRYRDLNNRGELTATQINLEVNDFKWDEPFDIHLEAAVMAPKQNLRVRTRLGPIAGNPNFANVPIDGEIHAEALDMGKINAALPQFRKALPRALRFDGVYSIDELRFRGTWQNLSLKGAVTGTDASFRFE